MADLDFSHSVSEIPAGQPISKFQREEKPEVTQFPNLQNAITNYAENTNWMSSIGSTVAARASNAIAEKLGSELGKNPKGDIGLPLTDFDKTMQQSYETQAHASLGLQADKLITDSNLEMAKVNRITPDLIKKTNQNISAGLQSIIKEAPDSIQPRLQSQYGALQISQSADLTERMIREQKQDRQNNTALASQMNAEHAYSFGLKGNDKEALAAIETTTRLSQADVAARLLTPQEAKANIDTARKAYLYGKYSNKYENATLEKKGEQFLRDLADKKPNDISDNDYNDVVHHVLGYANQQESLRSQNQQLLMAQSQVKLAENGTLSSDEIMNLKNNLTGSQFSGMQIKIIAANKKINESQVSADSIANNWDNVDIFGQSSPEHINNAFNLLTHKMIESSQKQSVSLTLPEAQMQVAISAAGPIPQYVHSLNLKGSSSNPQQLEEFGVSIDKIYDADKGQNISKVDPQAIANYEKYSVLKNNGMLPIEAAQQAHEIVYGKNLEQKKANDEAYIEYMKSTKAKGTTDQQFFLEQAGLSEDSIVRNSQVYANQMRTTFESYFKMLNGDAVTAQKMLKRSVSQNYGETTINGVKEYTYAPVNKLLNLPPNSDGVIHVDIAEQLSKQLESTNQAYKQGRSDWHWEVKPQMSVEQAISHESIPDEFKKSYVRTQGQVEKNIERFNTQNKVEVHKIYRDGRIEKYNVIIQANPYASRTLDPNVPLLGGWDVMLASDKGMSTIHSLDPRVGSISYRPNVSKINANVKKLHEVKYGD